MGIIPTPRSQKRRITTIGLASLITVWGLSSLVRLGGAGQLTYHEAFVAQGAREILGSGNWWYPQIGGLPWLEKPPLPFWLVAGLGKIAGEITPGLARLPFALAGLGLILGVYYLGAYRYGPATGALAGVVQATTAWTVLRARLAEADILLACVLTWALVAFDHFRNLHLADSRSTASPPTGHGRHGHDAWRWIFFGLLGVSSFIKGTGFGAALILAVVAIVLIWDRDRDMRDRLRFPAGWLVAAFLTVAWPLAMIGRHGLRAAGLWTLHVTQRLSTSTAHGVFARESWSEYLLNILGQGLPWTPLALVGGFACLLRATRCRDVRDAGNPGDRFLLAWAAGPLLLVSLASARNAHYAIYAMVPWSIWSAQGILILAERLARRGWSRARLRRLGYHVFGGLGLAYAVGFGLVGPWLDHRRPESDFYRKVGNLVPVERPVVLLYDDWDRDPYPTPFGPIPHDLALRLYHLRRPACWHFGTGSLNAHDENCSLDQSDPEDRSRMLVIARDWDIAGLEGLGSVSVIERAERCRWDRSYVFMEVQPRPETRVSLESAASVSR